MSDLTDKQEKALVALLGSPTLSSAATTAGIDVRTLHRWLEDEAFATAYRDARRKAVQQSIARLQQASSVAVSVLLGLMEDTTIAASVRLAAASRVLDLAIKAVELEDMDQRLATLEARFAH